MVSGDAIDLAVQDSVLVEVLIPMEYSAVCALPRYVPSPGRPSTGGNASNTSPEHAFRLPVSREWMLPGVNSV